MRPRSYVVDVAVREQTSTASNDRENSLPEWLYRLETLAFSMVLTLRNIVLARFPVEEFHVG